MNIEEITEQEEALLAKMPSGGDLDDRDSYLKKNGLYEEWRLIFDSYVELALQGSFEALKRALFLLWYETCEPALLSGLLDLDRGRIAATIEYLNTLLANDGIDTELGWMLPYYYGVAEWYLPKGVAVDHVLEYSREGEDGYLASVNKSDFVGRGQLGEYWRSIQL